MKTSACRNETLKKPTKLDGKMHGLMFTYNSEPSSGFHTGF